MADPQGLAFDAAAEDYDRGRAGWPSQVLDGVDGESVLDLAAGTGKLTALLAERYPQVLAVEPLAGMRAVLERNVPSAESFAGSAERIPLDDRSVDAVFVAEAFHWFDSGAAALEIARVLRPNGVCAVLFNDWRSSFLPEPSDEAQDVLRRVWERAGPPGGPKVQSGEWKLGFGEAPFGPFAEASFDHEATFDREGVLSYYVSTSSVARLPAAERERLREELRPLLPDVPHRLELTARRFSTRRL